MGMHLSKCSQPTTNVPTKRPLNCHRMVKLMRGGLVKITSSRKASAKRFFRLFLCTSEATIVRHTKPCNRYCKDIQHAFDREFIGMTTEEISHEVLIEGREHLILDCPLPSRRAFQAVPACVS